MATSTPVVIDEYISGGYFVTRPMDGRAVNPWLRSVVGAQTDLLPDQFLSVAFCGIPQAPTFSWSSSGNDDDLTALTIPLDRRFELEAWADARFNTKIGFPNVFFHLSTAREYVATFATSPNDPVILGIGLHNTRLSQLTELEQRRPPHIAENGSHVAGFENNGFAKALHMGNPPEPGEIVGFELICCDVNIDHSWHCNGLAVTGVETFNFYPNAFGLIDDKINADKLADYYNRPEPPRVEPGIWLPVLVTRYSPTP